MTTTYGFVRSMAVIERSSAMRAAVVEPPGTEGKLVSKRQRRRGIQDGGVEINVSRLAFPIVFDRTGVIEIGL